MRCCAAKSAIRLREDPKPTSRSRPKRKAATSEEIAITDIKLWQSLRDCRQRLASEHNVPPYVIFHDSTLRQMLSNRPRDPDALLEISGVGQAKLARYGEVFLEVIRRDG